MKIFERRIATVEEQMSEFTNNKSYKGNNNMNNVGN